ncbi:MAG: hypothetical protein JWO08_2889 [Verrucomicrobiaceae bacterium]|nr:hypothetical protein [Verrucomicrobiaceae bacterium]
MQVNLLRYLFDKWHFALVDSPFNAQDKDGSGGYFRISLMGANFVMVRAKSSETECALENLVAGNFHPFTLSLYRIYRMCG